jgi:hypothetical protein
VPPVLAFFCCVLPPGLLRLARHKPDGGDERVEQAGIVTLAGQAAEVAVHLVGVTAQQIVGLGNP